MGLTGDVPALCREIDRLRAELLAMTKHLAKQALRAEKAEAHLARCTCGAIDVRAAATGDEL